MQTPGRARSILMLPYDAQSAATPRLRSQACAAGGGACVHCYRACELALCIPSSLGGCGKIIQHGRNGIIGDGALYRPELVHANEVVRVCVRACPHVRSHAPVCAAVGAGLLIMPRVSPPSKASCTGCVTPGSCYSVSLKDGGRTGGLRPPAKVATVAQAARKRRKTPLSPLCQWKTPEI